jgi:hypothetical protein
LLRFRIHLHGGSINSGTGNLDEGFLTWTCLFYKGCSICSNSTKKLRKRDVKLLKASVPIVLLSLVQGSLQGSRNRRVEVHWAI